MLKAHLKEIINSKHHTLLVHENVYNSESSIHAPTELQYQEGSFKIDGLKSLMTVRGIGPSTARALYGRGYTTIEKLLKEYHINKPILEGLLTHQQLICLEHYHDLQSTLKRKEVGANKPDTEFAHIHIHAIKSYMIQNTDINV